VNIKSEENLIPKVKICCISSIEEAMIAIKNGASALGLVSSMPSGPGVINEDVITEIAEAVPPPIATFLLTSKQDAVSIINQQRKTKVNTLQLVDAVAEEELQKIRNELLGIKLVQVIHVINDSSVTEAKNIEKYVDAILLDSGNPKLKVKELGGTGRVHNWEISRKIVESVSVPVFLAGGLNESNILDAVEKVKPFGIDLCSSVRSNGNLDESKLKAFFNRLNSCSKSN
jgi:phosphoribosylanthranilate isomerase